MQSKTEISSYAVNSLSKYHISKKKDRDSHT